MSDFRIAQCCEHCLNHIHCNRHFKVRCYKFLNYISHLHKSNAHQEIISLLKDLLCSPRPVKGEGPGVRVNNLERRTSV